MKHLQNEEQVQLLQRQLDRRLQEKKHEGSTLLRELGLDKGLTLSPLDCNAREPRGLSAKDR